MTEIFWIKLNNLVYKSFFKEITRLEKQNIVFTPNPEMLLNAKDDKNFNNTLEKANFLIPDWIGLFIAYQILEHNNKLISYIMLPYYFFNLFFRRDYLYKKYWDRISGSDLTKDLVEKAEKDWIKITIIDLYNPTDSNKVKSQENFPTLLKTRFPKLVFDYYIYNPEKKQEIIENIKNSNSKILFSTLWMKVQEESIIEILWKASNIKLWLAIWSSFDYFIWFQRRAPKIWRQLGIEWLYRLFTWPRKLTRLKRLYNAIFIFIYEVIKTK